MKNENPNPIVGALLIQTIMLGTPVALGTGWGWIKPSFAMSLVGALHLIWAALESRWVPAPNIQSEKGPHDLAAWMGLSVLVQFWIASFFPNLWLNGFDWLTYLGWVAIGSGIALRALAIHQLGDFFLSPIGLRADHQLVTHGLYRWVRHPSEWGLWLITIGTGLAMQSAWAVVFALVTVVPLSWRRMRLEDQMLEKAFPQDFSAYKTSSW